ncbi:MAG: fatty acid desaturase [Myxococcales bacterium]|nr:fatty acid desaturase [Myxococcales bacterium]
MLRQHPEIRALVGPSAPTAFAVVGLVALQYLLAYAASFLPIWLAAVFAYAVGVPVAHALGVLIHECAHDLVFRRPDENRWLSILANMPLLFPAAIDFRGKHLAHHRRLGRQNEDTQAPTRFEIEVVGDSYARRFFWLSVGPVFFHGTPVKNPRLIPSKFFLAANFVACVGTMPLIFWSSPSSFVFLFVAALLAFGPHPVGIRRYAEHVSLAKTQPTNSYYGVWSRLAFNVGHHVEHHDFPNIAWHRLPRLKTRAREYYEPLLAVPSWSALLIRFLTDHSFGLDRYSSRGPKVRASKPPSRHPRDRGHLGYEEFLLNGRAVVSAKTLYGFERLARIGKLARRR